MIRTRYLVVLALACAYSLATQAQAQTAPEPAPLACLPKQMASTGSEALWGSVDGHEWFGWTCNLSGGRIKLEGWVREPGYQLRHPPLAGLTTPNQVFRAYYALNARECTSLGCGTARLAMRAAFGL